MKRYTREEMATQWMRRLGLETLRTDCSVAAFDGMDVNSYLTLRMRQWYLHLLDSADTWLLPARFVEPASATELCGGVLLSLGEGCRRPLSVTVEGKWKARVSPDSPATRRRMELCASPYAAPGTFAPLAVNTPAGLYISPATAEDEILVFAVVDPGPDVYELDESLLDTIK